MTRQTDVDGGVEVVGKLVHETDSECRLRVESFTGEEVAPRSGGPIRANTNGEMTAGMIPSRTSEKPKTASGDAIATSAHAVSPEPPPSA